MKKIFIFAAVLALLTLSLNAQMLPYKAIGKEFPANIKNLTLEQYKNLIKSFSHQEFNKPPYTTNNWIFKSHYCRTKINSPPGDDEPYEGWRNLKPNDPRLK